MVKQNTASATAMVEKKKERRMKGPGWVIHIWHTVLDLRLGPVSVVPQLSCLKEEVEEEDEEEEEEVLEGRDVFTRRTEGATKRVRLTGMSARGW